MSIHKLSHSYLRTQEYPEMIVSLFHGTEF